MISLNGWPALVWKGADIFYSLISAPYVLRKRLPVIEGNLADLCKRLEYVAGQVDTLVKAEPRRADDG